MIVVKVSTGASDLSSLFLRQTPRAKGVWGDCRFIINEEIKSCDWWIVCHRSGLVNTESTYCDPNNIVYISMEGSEALAGGGTSDRFIKQFSKIISCDRNIEHSDIVHEQVNTWWVGNTVKREEGGHEFTSEYTLDYDSLRSMSMPKKKTRISVIVSNKKNTSGHKKRLEFIKKLTKTPLGEFLDIFGHGYNPIPDKWDAIAPYKYHLCMENNVIKDYWTEKIGDAYLGFSVPIYWGCPNVEEFFPKESLVVIDVDNFEESVNKITKLLKEDEFESYLPKVIQARDKILNEYNIFEIMKNICNSKSTRRICITLKPHDSLFRKRIRGILQANKNIYQIYKYIRRLK